MGQNIKLGIFGELTKIFSLQHSICTALGTQGFATNLDFHYLCVLIYTKMKYLLAFALLGLLLPCCAGKPSEFETAVQAAVQRQLKIYPQSELKDLYKHFFQDAFGPGHLLSDTAAAGNYLRRELASFDKADGPIMEPTGWQGKFYRVNLSVLKEKKIPYEVFFDAFVRSVSSIEMPPLEDWAQEWKAIEQIISSMSLSLPNYETDKAEILEQLAQGLYVGHHSQAFGAHYAPHYRIISKDIFDNELHTHLSSEN
jgi:hypothetical protein